MTKLDILKHIGGKFPGTKQRSLIYKNIKKEDNQGENMMTEKSTQTYYGVSCLDKHLHEHRWIYDEEGMKEHFPGFYEEDWYNDSIYVDKSMTSDEELKAFLIKKCDGPDFEDPMMCDFGEYYLTIDTDEGSCTQEILTRLKLNADDLKQYDTRADECTDMLNKLEPLNLPELVKFANKNYKHFKDPLHGIYRSVRYSELCDIYEKHFKKSLSTKNNIV